MFIRTLISCLAVSLALVCTGCAEPVQAPLSKEEIADRKLMKEAYETGRQYRQQYIAAKRPVFRLKFRHQYPTMSEAEIEVLVNDAVEEGLREERQRLFGEPIISPLSAVRRPGLVAAPTRTAINEIPHDIRGTMADRRFSERFLGQEEMEKKEILPKSK